MSSASEKLVPTCKMKANKASGSHAKHSYYHPANQHWDSCAPLRQLNLVQENPPGAGLVDHKERLLNLKFHNYLHTTKGQLKICFPSKYQSTFLHTYIHTYIHIYIYIHTYIHTDTHTYIHNIHTYIHTYIHAYIHTYIHTYMRTCTYMRTM